MIPIVFMTHPGRGLVLIQLNAVSSRNAPRPWACLVFQSQLIRCKYDTFWVLVLHTLFSTITSL